MSFANQALSLEYMVKNHATLENKVYTVPQELDKRVAKLKLESMGIKIDRLTSELGLDKERARWWTIGQTLAWSTDTSLYPQHLEVVRWLLEDAE